VPFAAAARKRVTCRRRSSMGQRSIRLLEQRSRTAGPEPKQGRGPYALVDARKTGDAQAQEEQACRPIRGLSTTHPVEIAASSRPPSALALNQRDRSAKLDAREAVLGVLPAASRCRANGPSSPDGLGFAR